jgi:hypothetical protein
MMWALVGGAGVVSMLLRGSNLKKISKQDSAKDEETGLQWFEVFVFR